MNESPPEKGAKALPWSAHEASARPSIYNYLLLGVLGVLIIWSYQGKKIPGQLRGKHPAQKFPETFSPLGQDLGRFAR